MCTLRPKEHVGLSPHSIVEKSQEKNKKNGDLYSLKVALSIT